MLPWSKSFKTNGKYHEIFPLLQPPFYSFTESVMDILCSELELMATNSLTWNEPDTDDVRPTDIARWQQLFAVNYEEAEKRLRGHRNDFARCRISDDHWDLVRAEMELLGHDKESYEYSLRLSQELQTALSAAAAPPDAEYLLKLEGPLPTATAVQEAAGLIGEPPLFSGVDDSGDSSPFVIVDGRTKDTLSTVFKTAFAPIFIRHCKARKGLSSSSRYPELGIDTTLPQFRLDVALASPQQAEYPVTYFFYGTLAEPERLVRILQLEKEPHLEEAFVSGGSLDTWAGKYKALVDAERHARVDGWAYAVQSQEHEDALRYYETDKYEVVRCTIYTTHGPQAGLTFRFLRT